MNKTKRFSNWPFPVVGDISKETMEMVATKLDPQSFGKRMAALRKEKAMRRAERAARRRK